MDKGTVSTFRISTSHTTGTAVGITTSLGSPQPRPLSVLNALFLKSHHLVLVSFRNMINQPNHITAFKSDKKTFGTADQ